jgi:hydroxymethylglutaryl-CoA lyase
MGDDGDVMNDLPAAVLVRDVSLRDGLQDEAPISTDAKVAIAEALVSAGVVDFELTSFVRPDRVPAMADAEALCAATQHLDATRWGLVLNRRGAERALTAGLDHLQYVISVSDTHSRHNAGASTDDALVAFEALASGLANGSGSPTIELTLSTSFGCPYEGVIAQDAVVEVARRAAQAGATSIGLADTIGVAMPSEVATLVERVVAVTGVPIGAHLHDTRGLALANALVAIEHGATRLDASVGGLGGCPFAPGASGNLPIEDLVHALAGMGVETGCSVEALIETAKIACDAVGRPVGSHVGIAGARFAAPIPSPG